jgi:hypothetical protein
MSLEHGDLKRLIHDELHIDQFKSKLGEDKDIIVVSFKVAGKEPANDLVSFIEKGYSFVLDADVSSGEMGDGDYIVFMELEREPKAVEYIMEVMEDLMNLTEQDLSEWRVRYYKGTDDHQLDADVLRRLIPCTAREYERQYGKEEIDQLKTAAGVRVDTKAPKNEHTERLRIAAGIL